MSTTSVFAEILIAGIQASFWVALLVVSLAGYDWVLSTPVKLSDWAVLVTVVVIAVWYTLGIIVDQLANAFFVLFSPKRLLLRVKLMSQRLHEEIDRMPSSRFTVAYDAGSYHNFMNYIRSRIRIIRSTAFNLLFVIPSTVVFVITQCDSLRCVSTSGFVFAAIGIGVVLELLALLTLGMLQLGYDLNLKRVPQKLTDAEEVG